MSQYDTEVTYMQDMISVTCVIHNNNQCLFSRSENDISFQDENSIKYGI